MDDPQVDIRTKIERLLKSDLTDLDLVELLEDLQRTAPKSFREYSTLWAPALYERDPHFFQTFIVKHLHRSQVDVINQLLEKAEADGHQNLFTQLYERVVDEDRWNAEILSLAQSNASDEDVQRALEYRGNYYQRWVRLKEETTLILYQRAAKSSPKNQRGGWYYGDDATQHIRKLLNYMIEQKRFVENSDFSRLQKAAQAAEDDELYWVIFRATATQAQWQQELQSLIDHVTSHPITQELQKRYIRGYEMSRDVILGLIEVYGESVISFFEQNVPYFTEQALRTVLELDIDNVSLMREINQLRWRNYQLFPKMAHIWAPALYERDPVYFEKFLVTNLSHQQTKIIREMLPHIKEDGYDSLYRSLYGYVARNDEWNAEVLELAQSDMSDARVERAIDRIDIPSGWYYRKTNLMLKDEPATALYRRNANLFQDFIRRYVSINLYAQGAIRNYSLLIEAVQESGDDEYYWILFRKLADNTAWQAELEKILESDVSADDVVVELEKRHPDQPQQVNAAILAKFVEKYGEAVLPYFEKHLSWVTENRLKALLALDVQRGELRSELEAMARRQRRDFAQLASIWAPALYDSESEFFDGFLRNYLDWGSEYTIRKLLPQAESDGKDELFSSLYRRISREDEWQKEIEIFGKSQDMSDEEVLAAIERRDLRWYRLNERAALALYQRNHELFHAFILVHIDRHRLNQYSNLLKVADEVGDQALIRILRPEQKLYDREQWITQIKRLIDEDISPEDILSELELIHPEKPTETHADDAALMIQIIEKYGAVTYPYLEENAYWIATKSGQREKLLQMVERDEAWGTYHRLFFSLFNAKRWNSKLRSLLKSTEFEEEFLYKLQFLTPPPKPSAVAWGWRWYLEPDIATEIYKRYPDSMRSFIEKHVQELPPELFDLATQHGDEELLDYITYTQLIKIQQLVWQAYPPVSNYYRKPDDSAREAIETTSALIISRFNRLYDESPETYVRHAANVMSRIRAFEIRGFELQLQHNPVLNYIAKKHHEAWCASSGGILELMESPDIYVNLIGLDILGSSSEGAADRVVENLHMFRSLLLGRTKINTKKKVLACLENAAWQGKQYAQSIMPLLRDVIDFRGKRAISDNVMVAYVRLNTAFSEAEAG